MKYGVGDNKSNVKVTDVKRRYRMYKDGKKWVIAAAAAAGFILGPVFMGSAPSFAAFVAPTVQTTYNANELEAGAFTVDGTAEYAPDDPITSSDAYISVRLENGTEIGVAMLDDSGHYSISIPLTKATYGDKVDVYIVYVDGSKESKGKEVAIPFAQPGQPTVHPTANTDGSGTTVTGTAEPNATVTLTDKGTVVGTGTANGNGQYSIDVPYDKAPQGDSIQVIQETPGGKSNPEDAQIPYTAPDAPTIGAARIPGGSNTTVSGSGEPGAAITITDPSGKTVGSGTVDENGHYLVSVPLTDAPAGTDLTATQTLHELQSPPSAVAQVPYDKPGKLTPTISKPVNGVITVTGTAEPGAKVTLTPANGSPITTTANDNGAFTALVPESAAPENSTINVIQTTKGGDSDPATLTVPYATPDKPDVTLGTPTATDQPVSGTAEPGAEITITPSVDGKPGTPVTTTAGEDGKFNANVPVSDAPEGAEISTIQTTSGGPSPANEVVVPYTKPGDPLVDVGKPENGDVPISGSGKPGDTVTITPENGDPIIVPIGDDGQFKAQIPANEAKTGDDITVVEHGKGGDSDPVTKTVPEGKPEVPSVDLGTPTNGQIPVTGKGEPNATITVTPAGGTPVTTTADGDGNFATEIPESEAPSGTEVTTTQTTPGGESDPATDEVPYNKPAQPNIVVGPAVDGNVPVTGEGGTPGDTVTITPAGGDPITVPVGNDGKFKAQVPEGEAQPGSDITVVEHGKGGDSDPATKTVPEAQPDAPEVDLSTPIESQVHVTGTGEPNATVTVTPEGGTPVTTTADENGKFATDIPESEAPSGTKVTTIQTTGGGDSDPATDEVPYNKPSAPTIDVGAPVDGNIPVTGVGGTPGDTVTITPDGGNPITVPVGSDGTFKAQVPEGETAPGTTVTAVEHGKGGDSDPATDTVKTPVPGEPAVTVDAPTDGKVKVTGTGEPNATVTITPEGGDPVTTTADGEGNFETEIPETDAPSGTKITTTQTTPGGDSLPATDEVPYNKPAKPTLDVGAPENGNVPVSGTGEPGDTVTIKTDGSDPITVPIGDDGTFKAQIPETAPGTTVTAVETGKGGDSDPATDTVDEPVPDEPAVTVDKPTDGNVKVTGKGEPNATVTITPEGGDPVTTTADGEGNFETEIPETDAPSGTKITTTQTTPGGDSLPATDEVPYNAPAKPTVKVDAPENGSVPVSGTGEPGDTVTIKTAGGDPITVPVGPDGKFKTQIPENEAQPGSDVTVVETGKGGDSEPETKPVPYAVPDAPEANVAAPKDGLIHVTGTAEPGATITVTPESGDPVTGTADGDGNFALDVPEASAPSGSTLKTTQTTLGGDSDPDIDPVPYPKPVAQQPTIDAPKGGKVHITGTGEPGDTITLIPETGGQISVPVGDDGTYDITIPESKMPAESTVGVTETGKGGTSDRIDAKVPLAIPDAPTGVANPPKRAQVHVTGTAEAGAEVTLTTDSGVTQTMTADEQGNYAADFQATDAPIGSHISATQKTAGGVSDATAIEVPERPDLNAPDATITLTKPQMDGNLDVQEQARLRSASTPVLHVHGYTMSTNGPVPNALMSIYNEAGDLLGSQVSDENGYYSIDIPLSDKLHEGDAYYGQTSYDGMVSEKSAKTVPYAQPIEPTIGEITNDGTTITIKGHSFEGNMISVTGTTDDANSPSAIAGENGDFTLLIPVSFATPGTELQIYATNHTAVGPDLAITIPEVTTPATDTTDPNATTEETKEQTKVATDDGGVSVTADDFYDNRETPATTTEPATEPQTKVATDDGGVSVTADDFYDNRETPATTTETETQSQTKIATDAGVSVTADDFYDNRETPATSTETETTVPETQPQVKTATGAALSVSPDQFFDNTQQPSGATTTTPIVSTTPTSTVQTTFATPTPSATISTPNTVATTARTVATSVNAANTQSAVSTATTQPSATVAATTLPSTMGETTAATTKTTEVATATPATEEDTPAQILLPSTGDFDDEDTQTVAAAPAQNNAGKSAAKTTLATTSTKQAAKNLPSTGQSTLPQTGDRENSTMSIIGLALAAALGILGIFGIRKRHED